MELEFAETILYVRIYRDLVGVFAKGALSRKMEIRVQNAEVVYINTFEAWSTI